MALQHHLTLRWELKWTQRSGSVLQHEQEDIADLSSVDYRSHMCAEELEGFDVASGERLSESEFGSEQLLQRSRDCSANTASNNRVSTQAERRQAERIALPCDYMQ
jgi:hypothetical protein